MEQWLALQGVIEEVARERVTQADQWGKDTVPAAPSGIDLDFLDRDELVQLGACVLAAIQKTDRANG